MLELGPPEEEEHQGRGTEACGFQGPRGRYVREEAQDLGEEQGAVRPENETRRGCHRASLLREAGGLQPTGRQTLAQDKTRSRKEPDK